MAVEDLECAAGIVAEGEGKSSDMMVKLASIHLHAFRGPRGLENLQSVFTDYRSRLIDLSRSITSIRASEPPRHVRRIQTAYSNPGF